MMRICCAVEKHVHKKYVLQKTLNIRIILQASLKGPLVLLGQRGPHHVMVRLKSETGAGE